MAIYHLSTNVHSRGKGHSAVSAAAYRSGERLYDERLGETYDWQQYRKSHGEVLASEIFLPEGAPEAYLDRETLWNAAESAEKTKGGEYKKTAAVAREIEASLPYELNDDQRRELARLHAQALVERYGTAVDMNIHAPHPGGDQRNHHVHFLMTTRRLDENGFGEKCELELSGKRKAQLGHANGKEQVKELRKSWADHVNRELERAGHSERIDERSYTDQGQAKSATQHLGPSATAMERRGEKTRIGDKNREAEVWNRELADLEWQDKVIDLAIEREKRRMAQERREKQSEKEIRADAREIRKIGSYAASLDRERAMDAEHQRRRFELEDRLKQFYARDQAERLLSDAQERAAKSDTFFGRLSGRHRAALDQAEAYQKNLDSIDQRVQEQRGALERQIKIERDDYFARTKPPAPQPERAPEPERVQESEQAPQPRSAREMMDRFERSASPPPLPERRPAPERTQEPRQAPPVQSARERMDAFERVASPGPTPANDNEKQQKQTEPERDRGRDYGGYER